MKVVTVARLLYSLIYQWLLSAVLEMMSLIVLCTEPPAAYQLVERIGPLKIFETYIKHLLINRTNCRAQTHCYCLLHNNLIVTMPCLEIIQMQIGIPCLTLLHSTNDMTLACNREFQIKLYVYMLPVSNLCTVYPLASNSVVFCHGLICHHVQWPINKVTSNLVHLTCALMYDWIAITRIYKRLSNCFRKWKYY